MATTYSIIVMKDGASPPDVSRGDIINVQAPWDLVVELTKLALKRYPGADRALVVDEDGIEKFVWSKQLP
jgi:hypothetical protein